MEKKLFYKSGAVKSFSFPFSPIMTGFNLSQDYKVRDLKIDILDPKGKKMKSYSKKRKVLYNAPVDWEARPEDLFIHRK